MGGLWQALAFGFAGLRPRGQRLQVDPHLPPDWKALQVRIRFRGSRVRVRSEKRLLTIHADPPAAVLVDSTPYTAGPGGLRFSRRGSNWQLVP